MDKPFLEVCGTFLSTDFILFLPNIGEHDNLPPSKKVGIAQDDMSVPLSQLL